MPDLSERIREFVDTAQPSVTTEEIKERLHRPKGRAVRTSRRIWILGGSAVVAGIAALLAVLLTVPAVGPGRSGPASAAEILRRAADVADSQQPLLPGPGQFLYVRLLDGSQEGSNFSPSESGQTVSNYYVQDTLEQWTAPNGPNHQTATRVGQPEFLTERDRQLWEQDGSPLIEAGNSGGGTADYYDVADLPSDPSRIASYFRSHSYFRTQSALPVQGTSDAFLDFLTAANFLDHGASADQRAALLRFMATIPGVVNAGSGTTLGTKLTGSILSLPTGTPGNSFQVLIDPSTSVELEQRTVVSTSTSTQMPGSKQFEAAQAAASLAGQATGYQDFLYAGIADSSDSTPNGGPAPLIPWPSGTGRDPLPRTAY